jgi:hypothetical protein
VLFFRQRSVKNERRDRETRRGQNHNEISHDFLRLMVEILELLKIAVGNGAFSHQAMEATTRLMR